MRLGEALAEPAKFAALLVFGATLTPALFGDLSIGGHLAVVLTIALIRPASLLISLPGVITASHLLHELLGAAGR